MAELYEVTTSRLNEQVKRNKQRFPEDFMFQISNNEIEILVSQNAIPSVKHLGGHKPKAFTEHGVANLSSVLRSKKAVEVNIKIIRAFVSMRKIINSNYQLFEKINNLERNQIGFEITTNNKFEKVFNLIQEKNIKPEKGIFYDGQVFDAHKFVSDIIRTAEKEIILIDNYIDDSVLILLSKKKKEVKIIICTDKISEQLKLDIKKYEQQNEKIQIKEFKKAHDRFLIIDENEIYHIGASIKDLGKKWFAFSKFDKEAITMLKNLN